MMGKTLGKYRIDARLGRGGMGTVYKATDETLGREVALKILNPDLADTDILRRFRAEAVTLARLNHPNIATLYELCQYDHELLMVMEYVRGETFGRLSDRIGPMPIERAASLCSQVLDALGHAHRVGIVHRDLKPANLMLAESGTVKVMDFGIARVMGTEHLTTDGYVMGTPAYMAPEQVLGADVDGRADLYAIGVVLYRLLTGNLPFKADTAIAMLQKQIKDPPAPLRQFRADLPAWCGELLERALAKAPGDRFQRAEEFRAALARAGAPVLTPAAVPALDETIPPNSFPTPAEIIARAPTPARIAPDPAIPAPVVTDAPGAPGQAPRAIETTTAKVRQSRLAAGVVVLTVILIGLGALAITVIVRLPAGGTQTPEASAPPPPLAPAPAAPTTASPPGGVPVLPPSAPPPSAAGNAAAGTTPESATRAPAPAETPGPAPSDATSSERAALPPIVFQGVKVLSFDGEKWRERDASLRLADGIVEVLEPGLAVKSTPYRSVVALFVSHSKAPQWVTPTGSVAPVGGVSQGKFGFFRGDRDWITLRIQTGFIPLRPDASVVSRLAAALEQRTGLTFIRADVKD